MPGTYLVVASDPHGRYATEWYEEAAVVEQADRVVVPAGEHVDGIDFTLGGQSLRTRLFIKPSLLGLTVGGTDELAVAVGDVRNLAAFELEVSWNPDVFEVTGVQLGDFLGSTGREVIPVEPVIDNGNGRLSYGAASVGDAPGPSGHGDLFAIKVAAKTVGETAVEIAASTLTDPGAGLIPHDVGHGRVHVGRCMRGDFDCNCVIDISDVMAVVMRWGAVEGDPEYEPQFDLDGDGDIDIVDVQIEASLWGKRCDTSAAPSSRGEPGTTAPLQRLAEGGGPGILPVLSPDGAALRLAVAPPSAAPGARITLSIAAQDVTDLSGFDLVVRFDPAVLSLAGADLGAMITASDRTFHTLGPDSADGSVAFGAFSFPGPVGPSGAGELAVLTFDVIGSGATPLTVERAVFVDSSGRSAPATGDETLFSTEAGLAVFIPSADQRRR
jgi:hypothetical protein